jgi:hypothetical protein
MHKYYTDEGKDAYVTIKDLKEWLGTMEKYPAYDEADISYNKAITDIIKTLDDLTKPK